MGANETLVIGGLGGDSGGGAGAYLEIANNLSDLASAASARTNLGFSTLTDYVTLTGTQTLTNKTLTSPTVTAPTITGTTSITGTTTVNSTGVSSFTVGNNAGSVPIDFISRQSPTSTVYTTSTNAVIEDFALHTKSTSGTPAAGYGGKLNFYADSNGNTNRNLGYLGLAWSTATDASRTAYAEFRLVNSGALIQAVDVVPGGLNIYGTTSGAIGVRAAAAAGTWTLTLPTTDGNANEFLQTDGSGVSTWAVVTDALLSTSDITTNNVSTTKHGFAPKAPNDATKFLNGVGAWAVPSGGGSGYTVEIITGGDATDAGGSSTSRKVAVGSTAVVLLAGNTNVLRSTDGTTWSAVAHGASAHSIDGNPNTGVIAINQSTSATVVRRSTDNGSTWGNATGTIAQVGGGIKCNPATNVWIVWDGTTSSSAAMRSTDDAATFSAVTISHASVIRYLANDGASGGTAIWLGVINGTTVLKSTDDGATWSTGTALSWTAQNISFGGTHFVVTSTSSTYQFAYSTNGTSWTYKPYPIGVTTSGMAYADGYWYFIPAGASGAGLYRTADITAAVIEWEAIPVIGGAAFPSSGGATVGRFSGANYFNLLGQNNCQATIKLTI